VRKMLSIPMEVTSHIAGQRPTVRDRRPLLGKLDDHELYAFNGLGTRGSPDCALARQRII